jgi:hypothetical protein
MPWRFTKGWKSKHRIENPLARRSHLVPHGGMRVEDPTDNGGRGWRRFTAEEIADVVYIAVRLIRRSIRNDLSNRNPSKVDEATRKVAKVVATRLEDYPTFGPARNPKSHTAGGRSDPT